MKPLFLFLILFNTLYAAISEFKSDDYQIILGDNFDDEALDIIEDYDYNISVVGYSQDFKKSVTSAQSYHNAFDYLHNLNANAGEQLRLIKLNFSADIVKDTRFKLNAYNRGTNIIKTAQNGYILGGYTHNGQMLISYLDTHAQRTSLQKFGTANFDKLYSLSPLEDGGSIAIGTSQTSRNPHDDMFVQGLGRSDVYLVRFKRDGQVRWKKKYGTLSKDIGIDAVATGDGGFILLGISQESNEFRLSCAKINDTGDIAWIKKFPKAGRQKAFKIIQTNHGHFLISASFENKNNQDNIRLIEIDNEGNVLWDKNYFNNAHEQLNDISTDLRGNIIGVGSSQDESQGDMDALVRYYDHNGKLIWERKFGKHRHDAFKAVSLLHDNTFALAGFSNSFANKQRQIWILKLNDDGTLVKKKLKANQGIYKSLKEAFEPEALRVFNTPSSQENRVTDKELNPPADSKQTSTKLSIYKNLTIVHPSLIFKQGSSTLTAKHKAILKEFMPKLIKTLEPYKDTIKNIQIQGFTSTEWQAPDTQRYLNNAKLANERALSVLNYSYKLGALKQHKAWMSQVFSTDGYSYSNLIYTNDKENKIRSRRVEFEVILK